MKLILMFVLVAAMVVLFFSGFFVGMLKERYGKNLLILVPVCIALVMFNIIWALTELAKSARWQ
ncbi:MULTISPECIES: hypothetical protein [Neobacillus]|uniref:Histidine kinase n=1 Tax=Neobacillus rhizosphaerae TaxID=2880965 RepID=A0ABN8KIE8_9BACI|nr:MULTISPECIES: hypothetical protein [Neobacillus]CAH2713201.1 hypothetical protein BACCIP111895_00336 [Neobacillus rhizosphaerae]